MNRTTNRITVRVKVRCLASMIDANVSRYVG